MIKTLALALLLPMSALAGGLVTNTNQSASFTRNPAQDAVIDVTGVYYNPAGLAFLENGFHLSVNNQSIVQTRTINSSFPNMNRNEFEGSVNAPLFPGIYAAYKQGSFAYSLGINPIGGGGSADFQNGLPSFEQQVAILPGALTQAGIATDSYSMDAAFDGSSLNWGLQVNASYAFNEMISVSLGVRYIIANNTYEGHLRDVMINPMHPFNPNGPGQMVSATAFFSNAATTLHTMSSGATLYSAGLSDVTAAGYGEQLLSNAENFGFTAEQVVQMQGLIVAAGQNPSEMDIQTASAVLGAAAPAFSANAQTMEAYIPLVADKKLDASQSGTGFAPVFGLNLNLSPDFNIALKYEHRATITMTNSTVVDDVNMYPDGVETPNDMPAMLAVGAGYRILPTLKLSAGMHYYFDKSADYGKSLSNEEIIDNNFWEAAFGLEYSLSDAFLLSAGYLRTQTGVNDTYHSDLSHSLSTNTFGFGGKYMINNNIGINLGIMNTFYESYTKSFTIPAAYEETYKRSAISVGLGLDFKF